MKEHYQANQQSRLLSVLSTAPAAEVSTFADQLLANLPEVKVIENRTGLVMVPYTDTRKGATFHMGETLIAEARVSMESDEGYGACMGRDTQHALAIAVLDVACQSGHFLAEIEHFVTEQEAIQNQDEETLLKKVESTRVEMETY
ncbi:MAG TPA: phosphonate C-P lyase system protein PhnG [Gammaproteobacteria bacterium]|nr:MAG: phosphonate C-P lyase system protein PhnG [Gammaproteobacteria bacterium TMED163]HAO87907.1 phosphonate C-P lyase system protein PhnG [Gammaproteobacteria bacterium]HAR90629.1 phosphonate C-P lyase system protein PhnG [Gammaproteobacteria bacterium]|tara:strand:+ start:219 stop:653 length:435 start_codon:yes stop_codon:yes gene_type:complete